MFEPTDTNSFDTKHSLCSVKDVPPVSIIILNHNGMEHIKDCLDSVRRLIYPNFETILVDNASTDGSVEFVRGSYPWVRIVQNDRNLGFAAGNNVGFSSSRGEYVFFLNTDTEIDPHCLNSLVRVAESDNSVGICGCKLLLFYKRNVFQSAGGRYNLIGIPWDRATYEIDLGKYDKTEEVSFVCGAALLIKRDIASRIGGFDPAFFMYNEDVDLCIRSWVSGFRVVYVPNAVVYHKWQWGVNRSRRPDLMFHAHKNAMLTLLKNFSATTVLRWLPLALIYKLFWFSIYLANSDLPNARAIIDSLVWIPRNLSYIIRERRRIMPKRVKSDSILKRCCAPSRDVFQEYRRRIMLNWGSKGRRKLKFVEKWLSIMKEK